MDNFEKYFQEHRDEFDDQEPSSGHFQRFEEKYNDAFGEPPVSINRSLLLKIAAGILILLTVSVFLFDFSFHRLRNMYNEHAGTQVPSEIQQAEQYYMNSASDRIGQISKLACCGQDTKMISADASESVRDLDNNDAELKKAMAENPNNERIQAAFIQNQQMKKTIVDNVIRQMNRVKK